MAAYVVAITGISMGGSNVDVGIIASLLIFFSLFIRVAFKASFFIAILALPLLMIGGLGLLAITAILYLIFGQNKESKAQQTNQP
ncbi:MAG: hypothetical protein K2Y31_17175 [Burkholderiales bacterium]|nr:hypothetical protein [Burkholderiales bacterium]